MEYSEGELYREMQQWDDHERPRNDVQVKPKSLSIHRQHSSKERKNSTSNRKLMMMLDLFVNIPVSLVDQKWFGKSSQRPKQWLYDYAKLDDILIS